MAAQNEFSLQDRYLVLKLTKQVDLGKLIKMLRSYQKEHLKNPAWRDLADILSSVELDQVQTKIGEYFAQ